MSMGGNQNDVAIEKLREVNKRFDEEGKRGEFRFSFFFFVLCLKITLILNFNRLQLRVTGCA